MFFNPEVAASAPNGTINPRLSVYLYHLHLQIGQTPKLMLGRPTARGLVGRRLREETPCGGVSGERSTRAYIRWKQASCEEEAEMCGASCLGRRRRYSDVSDAHTKPHAGRHGALCPSISQTLRENITHPGQSCGYPPVSFGFFAGVWQATRVSNYNLFPGRMPPTKGRRTRDQKASFLHHIYLAQFLYEISNHRHSRWSEDGPQKGPGIRD